MQKKLNKINFFQAPNGAIELRQDASPETMWANLNQIAQLFEKDKSVISRHINNIYNTQELDKNSTVAKIATVQNEGKRKVTRKIDYYNLDVILSVGYRVNSIRATHFRIWATQVLKQHITDGFTINQKVLNQNKIQFIKALDDLKILSQTNKLLDTENILSIIQSFSGTFFNLESFDKCNFPKQGTIKEIQANAQDLHDDLQVLKQDLINKGEATQLFAQEKNKGQLKGILSSVFQSVFGADAYPSIEGKAAHLLYFIVKNHPFNDGNKRSGAFAFIWLLQKAKYDSIAIITPETLTALTLLIAQSNPLDKDKMIGVILLLLNKKHNL